MGLRVNNNIASLNSYNNLQRTDKSMSSSLQKLSSGLRINKAADDAAGLVVSEGLRSQIGGLTTAARNAQDGVNVAQTADGALGTVTSMLQRMRDLAVQSANTGSADQSARDAAQLEFDSLRTEITRVATSTKFGGQSLLDGTYGATPAKITAFDANNSITLTTAGNFTIDINGIGAVTVSVGTGTFTGAQYAAVLENAIKSALSTTSVSGAAAFANQVKVDAATVGSGSAITLNVGGLTNAQTFALTDGTSTPLVNGGFTPASVTAASGSGGTFQIGANGADQINVAITDVRTSVTGISASSLTSGAGATSAISALDTALSNISTQRANLGAVQNRFEYTINNLNVSIENITASESAIRDTDMAAEMSKYTRSQILSQAGTSMLAQANSSSQNILTLLRG